MQIWPIGGQVERVVLSAGFWSEFVPTPGIDAYLVQADPVGRIVRTSTASIPDLVPGAAVMAGHLDLCLEVYAGQDQLGIDADTGVRFFFALVDAAPETTASIRFERAVS